MGGPINIEKGIKVVTLSFQVRRPSVCWLKIVYKRFEL